MSSASRSWMDAESKSDEAADVATSGALFDLSSYTGGAPLIPMETEGAAGDTATASDVASHGMFDQDVPSTQDIVAKHTETEEKKLGRPSHPAWQYFVRGEKRNRFHHNAYCKFCTDSGVDPVAVRGVSGNMIRHLQKCIYCPAEVVTQLKLLCAQKDAANFNKKHQSQSRSVDILLHEASPAKKKARKNEERSGGTVDKPSTPAAAEDTEKSHAQHSAGVEDFMPLQLPALSSEGNANNAPAKPISLEENFTSQKYQRKLNASSKPRVRDAAKKSGTSKAGTLVHRHTHEPATNEVSQAALQKWIVSSTVSMGLPWDWILTEQSARTFDGRYSKVDPQNAAILQAVGETSHEKQILKMKDEQVGVTLAVSWWKAKCPRSSFVLFSLVNALGESTVWELIDMGIEDTSSESLAEKIKTILTTLREECIHVINIVADTVLGYTASRLAVSLSDWTSSAMPVLPCFSHLLQVLLGIILTASGRSTETMGEVIELVRIFSNHRVLNVLRRECGDPDAVLRGPTYSDWYSFIEAIDSVRQYEDMIKIISSKVVQATSDAEDLTTKPSNANPRKDSAGNTAGELAECGLTGAAIQTIQSVEFWENVVALSELMSPLKETYKMMNSTYAATFSLSDVFYQLGRMRQQYGIILSDWEDTTGGGRSVEQVRFLMRTVNNMWKMYDQPLMVLSYTFNYNLQHPFFARHQPSLQWLSIGKYAKQYFRSWFCAASATRNPSRILALSDEAVAQFMEDILTFKERKYPFDSESMCDFENPKLFYMLVSDSRPLMHIFGSRLFSFVTCTPPLGDILPGKCIIPSLPSMAYPQHALLPLLRLKLFAKTVVRPSKDVLGFVRNSNPVDISEVQLQNCEPAETDPTFLPDLSVGKPKALEANDNTNTLKTIWSKRQWISMGKEWKSHWETETNVGELVENSNMLHAFATGLTLDQVFKDKLPSRLPHDREDAVVDV